MPTALITGILGQDGSLLAELLVERGYRVVGIARPGSISTHELIELDLAQATGDWASAIIARVQPDEIYHLAAAHRSSEPGVIEDLALHQRMIAVNHTAAVALAQALIARGRGRLVLAASSQMYTAPARVDEQTPQAPSTFYGTTKAMCLDAIAQLRAQDGLAASTAILFNHESPRRPPSFVSRKITLAAARIAAGSREPLELGDVWSRVDFSSAHDVVAALHAMALGEPADRVVASGELHTIAELCEAAFGVVGLDWADHVQSRKPPGERAALVGDPGKIERELGWLRRRSFAEWVREMVMADIEHDDEVNRT